MDLEQIAPILEQIVKNTLRERRYPFGGRKGSLYTGLSNKVASGTLINSVKVIKQESAGHDFLTVDLAPFGIFVDEGKKPGTFVPVSAIMQWLQEKGIGIRNPQGQFVKGHRQTKKSYEEAKKTGQILPAAFAIQKNINKFGIRSANFTDIVYQKIQDDRRIMKIIEKESIQDLLNRINFQAIIKQ